MTKKGVNDVTEVECQTSEPHMGFLNCESNIIFSLHFFRNKLPSAK